MSQHSSLRVASVGVKHRNVFKRHERIRKLKEMEKWREEQSIFGLPKVKSLKIKVRKAKTEKAADEKAAVQEATPQAGAKPAAPPKAEAAKPASQKPAK